MSTGCPRGDAAGAAAEEAATAIEAAVRGRATARLAQALGAVTSMAGVTSMVARPLLGKIGQQHGFGRA